MRNDPYAFDVFLPQLKKNYLGKVFSATGHCLLSVIDVLVDAVQQ